MINGALVLEGGALRSVYSAGVLDVFLEKDLKFEYVLGISAGALTAGNYISGQIGRTAQININYADDPRYIGIRQFIRHGNFFNLNFLFDKPVGEWDAYDENAFMHTKQRFVVGATNCLTGRQDFFEKYTYRELVKGLAASSTLPLLSKITYIDDVPYIDGGVSNAIPFEKAMKEGYKKIVIILTRPDGYIDCDNKILDQAFRVHYRKYPNLVKKLCTMSQRYNYLLRQIRKLEREKKVFVIRPTTSLHVKRVERNKDKLRLLYLEGKEDARNKMTDMMKYLEAKPGIKY